MAYILHNDTIKVQLIDLNVQNLKTEALEASHLQPYSHVMLLLGAAWKDIEHRCSLIKRFSQNDASNSVAQTNISLCLSNKADE